MRRPPVSGGPNSNIKLRARPGQCRSHSVADASHTNYRRQSYKKSTALVAEQPVSPKDEKPDQRCDWCGKLFRPRHGTGGSKQKFCSRECQRTSNKESQRTHRRAAYVAPKTTPAISEVDRNETLPREPGVATLHPWQTGVLDIADCDRTEFVVALNDSEAAGTRVESWPPEIRALMDHRVHRWVEDNKETRSVRAMTVASPKYDGIQSCVVILHHVRKDRHPALRRDPPDAVVSEAPGNV